MVTIGTFYYPTEFTFTLTVIKQNTLPILRYNLAAFFAKTISLTTAKAKQSSIMYPFLLVSLTPLQAETASQSEAEDTPKGLALNLKFKCFSN